MASKIIISTSKNLVQRLQNLFNENERIISIEYKETFPFKIESTEMRPAFVSEEQVDYLKKIGVRLPKPEQYRIYIGKGVSEIREMYAGVELPVRVLNDKTLFRKEILSRIRKIVKSPRDN